MKKISLSLIYPLWFFFSKTWTGNIMMIPISLAPIPILIQLIFPELMTVTGEEAESLGLGISIFTLLCSPFTVKYIFIIGDNLEANYVKWNYKTEMETKMI